MCYCCTLCNRCGRADEMGRRFGKRACHHAVPLRSMTPHAPAQRAVPGFPRRFPLHSIMRRKALLMEPMASCAQRAGLAGRIIMSTLRQDRGIFRVLEIFHIKNI